MIKSNGNTENKASPNKFDNNGKKVIKRTKGEKQTDEFKKQYFQYYDDIKISDRQDW